MNRQMTATDLSPAIIQDAVTQACLRIPPAWPLDTSVAVNPFLGHANEPLAVAATRLHRLTGVSCMMPLSWYQAKIDKGAIHVAEAAETRAATIQGVEPQDDGYIPSVADLSARVSGFAWPRIVEERFGHWASCYLDEGQALWAAPRERDPFKAWHAQALHDLTPEIAGLKGFARFVAELPDDADGVLARAAGIAGMRDDALEAYFHQLLLSLGGWAHVARYRQWRAELAGGTDMTLRAFLAIRLVFDLALMRQYGSQIHDAWLISVSQLATPVLPSRRFETAAVLQGALERSSQRRLAEQIATNATAEPVGQPELQAVFCIDVRSEVFRRALESLSPDIETKGFAGFFGLGLKHRASASDVEESRLPVLLAPTIGSRSSLGETLDGQKRIKARAERAWGRFRHAAVSSFSFVESAGVLYAGKLLRSALGRAHHHAHDEPMPTLESSVNLATRVDAAEAILRAMSLTQRFAPIVLLLGHGATTVNNPHASALQCGACGGHAGDVNARVLAGLLNDPDVRKGLGARGLVMPEGTTFIAGLHDTTTDRITLFASDVATHVASDRLQRITTWLKDAGAMARAERAARLPGARGEASVEHRSRNWSETRPEWGLAGCSAFIAAPRERTRGCNLGGRAFLHDYDWTQDKGFKILELILTAPVVVASWISLQYYGSSVAPSLFGGGNKLLHNVTGGIGVVEGSGGNLRAGLPWQSVHDGQDLVHEPLRLSVVVAAPCAAITDILSRHEGVRALFDNGWLHLLGIDDKGHVAWRYTGDLRWEAFDSEATPLADEPRRQAATA